MNQCNSTSYFNTNKISVISPSSNVHTLNTFSNAIAKGDSGARHYYISPKNEHILQSTMPSDVTSVLLPNNNVVHNSTTGILPLSNNLSPTAQTAHVIPELHSSLVSLGQLADDDCSVVLNKHKLSVFKNFKCILTDTRNTTDGLWDIPIH